MFQERESSSEIYREFTSEWTKTPEKPLRYLEYIGGPLHVHTKESESGMEATHSLEEEVKYLRDQVDKGTGRANFLVVCEHSEHIGLGDKLDQYFTPDEATIIREGRREMEAPVGSKQLQELPPESQKLIARENIFALEEQRKIIEHLNQQEGERIRIISGVETSIVTPQGGLSLPNEGLAKVDVAIASIHPDVIKTPQDTEQRVYENTPEGLVNLYMNVLENPHVDIIGHPIKGNMREINVELQKRLAEEGTLEPVLGPLMQKMTEKNVAFELNLKDPLSGLKEGRRSKDSTRPETIYEEVIRLAAKYKTPLSIGIDWHLFRHWQNIERMTQTLSDKDRELLEKSASEEEWKKMDKDARQKSEDIRRQDKIGLKFWLRLTRLCRTLERYNIPKKQVVNSSKERFEQWIQERKNQ